MASDVQEHSGYGIGVYHFFRDNAVTVQSGKQNEYTQSTSLEKNAYSLYIHALWIYIFCIIYSCYSNDIFSPRKQYNYFC